MGFIGNFIHFPTVKEFKNRLTFEKVRAKKEHHFYGSQCICTVLSIWHKRVTKITDNIKLLISPAAKLDYQETKLQLIPGNKKLKELKNIESEMA